MAYRRKQVGPSSWTFNEEFGSPQIGPSPTPPPNESLSPSSASSLAAKAIRASSAYRDSSLSSAYGHSTLSPSRDPNLSRSPPPSAPKDSNTYEYTSMKSLSEPKHGFWGVLARKAKAILDDDNAAQQSETPGRMRPQMSGTETRGQEGRNIVENRTADIIQETRKLQIRKKGSNSEKQNQMPNVGSTRQQPLMQTHMQPQMHTDLEIQLKASRDVAMAMATKAKLLLRELKTVKADLAFAKERCAQLEEENRIVRESLEKGVNPEDDDLIRLQLETLLAEKARLAQENSVFARENRFLREIVEYHQLTMQDVVYFDEGNEEVKEVYSPITVSPVSNTHSIDTIQTSAPSSSPRVQAIHDVSPIVTPLSSFIDMSEEEDLEKLSHRA
ncbi:uncharacterized protein LOC114286131 isoform X2 [Camellia sinensis]|uniref:uncharacterized protein LOC114286131 isoform X2 n=1 Tax=Camellia sinensis TaxID=4442 RepID=UPI0010364BD0|nr:uncharacterized protein LOC114286131 isoform X2 [Camellia sinensis]